MKVYFQGKNLVKGFIEAIEERGDSLTVRGNYFLKEGTTFSETKGKLI